MTTTPFRTEFQPLSGATWHRRAGGIFVLPAILALVGLTACGGDSSAAPDQDDETAEFRLLRPGTVMDLSAEATGGRSVTLTFTEVTDGLLRPASYEVRYHVTPIRNGWNQATVASEGSCSSPFDGQRVGARFTCTVEGLNPGTSYDFQLVAFRRGSGGSMVFGRLSNVATAVTSAGGGGGGSGPAAVYMSSGNEQTGEVGTTLAQELVVKVLGSGGSPLQGVTVNWTALDGGSVAAPTSQSDAGGYARMTRTLGTAAGRYRTRVEVSGVQAFEFGATAVPGPAARVSVNPPETTVEAGNTTQLTAVVEDQYGNRIDGPVTWASSDLSVASVNSSGWVLGVARGVTSVTASVAGASASAASVGGPAASPATGGSTVQVTDGNASIPGSLVIASGSGQSAGVGSALPNPLVVEVRNAAGGLMPGASVSWSIVSGTGTLSATQTTTAANGRTQVSLTLGTTAGTVQVRAQVEGVPSVTFSATAQPGPLASIVVTPGSTSTTVGGTVQFSASLRDQHGNTVPGTPTWSSSATSIATVSSSGLATGVAGGSAQIRATVGSVTGSGSLTVTTGGTSNPGTVNDLSVTGTTTSSATLRFTAVNDGTGSPARYQIRFHTTPIGFNWGTATPVASGTCAGVVTSPSIGQQITCTVEGLAAGTSYDFQAVAYRGTLGSNAVFGGLSNVATGQTGSSSPTGSGTLTISPRGGTLTAIGATLQLSATARDGSGNTISNAGITWSSSNTNVATVDASGHVTARGIGTAIISVAASCCTGDQVQVSVTQQISSITVSPASASVAVGGTRQFEATARDANGNAIPNVVFSWTSSNNSVATVNGSGTASGVAQGSAQIRASAGGQMGQGALSVTTPTTGSPRFPNEPAGYVAIQDISWAQGSRWGWHSYYQGAYGEVRSDGNGPTSAPHYFRAFYPAGMQGGYEAAVASAGMSGAGPGGFFMAYTFRLSENWHQHESHNMGVKHMIPFVRGGELSDARFFGWTGWVNFPGRPEYRVGSTVDGWASGHPRRDLEWVNESAAFFRKGEWVTVEMHVEFNSGGPNTGRVRVWVNGVLTQQLLNQHFPATHLSNGQIAGTFGGGIGNVPNNQWYEVDHVYFSTPRP